MCATLAYMLPYSASGNRLASGFPGFNHIPGINVAVAARPAPWAAQPQPLQGSPPVAAPKEELAHAPASLTQESEVYLFIQQFPVVRDRIIRFAFVWTSHPDPGPRCEGGTAGGTDWSWP